MYRRPYLTACALASMAIIGISGQIVVAETYKIVFLGLTMLPLVLGLAWMRWR